MTMYTITVPKANANYVFDTTKLPAVSLEYIMDYGFRQAVVDATAQMVRKDFKGTDAEFAAEAKKKADARVAAIRSGAVRKGGAVDPFVLMATTLGITVEELKKKLGTADAVTPAKGKAA